MHCGPGHSRSPLLASVAAATIGRQGGGRPRRVRYHHSSPVAPARRRVAARMREPAGTTGIADHSHPDNGTAIVRDRFPALTSRERQRIVAVRDARSYSGVTDPVPVMARYRPSLSPMTTRAPPSSAPRPTTSRWPSPDPSRPGLPPDARQTSPTGSRRNGAGGRRTRR